MSVASESNPQAEAPPVALPPSAPTVRIFSNRSDQAPAEWKLTEPAAIVGWGANCDLVLDDKTMSKMQCLVVNTAREVLLRDLHSPVPTLLNDEPTSFAVLSDGDRISVGDTTLTVHIESAPTGGADPKRDPLKLPGRLVLEDTVSPEKAVLEKAVTLLGRRESLDIHLDDSEVSPAHAAIFHCADRPMFFDLRSRKGSTINHRPQRLCPLNEGDLLRMGPFEVKVRLRGWPKADSQPASPPPGPAADATASAGPLPDRRVGLPAMNPDDLEGLVELRRKVSDLCEELLAFRGRLANWESDLAAYIGGPATGGEPGRARADELTSTSPAEPKAPAEQHPPPEEASLERGGPQQALERFGQTLDRARDILAGGSPTLDEQEGAGHSPSPGCESDDVPSLPASPPTSDPPDASPDRAENPAAAAETATLGPNCDSDDSGGHGDPAPTKPPQEKVAPLGRRKSEISSLDLDPEVAEQLRLLRRLNPHVDDLELLERIEAERNAKNKSAGRKSSWWSRR
jgi:pSer/pThr/pTyr-binding forkhead associated (FHA) protein